MPTEHDSLPTAEALKQAIDLVEFAERYTKLHQISRAGEFAGPCPRCGGEDRFHVKGQRFYCRQCYPRGGDVIDLVRLLHNLSFREACRFLSDETSLSSERSEASASPVKQPKSPREKVDTRKTFAESARLTMLATARKLLSPEGAPGQSYLTARGLDTATWQAYRLGFGQSFHPYRRRNEPAIFVPWLSPDGNDFQAIRFRFIDPSLTKAERYALKSGSHPSVFGLHLLRPSPDLLIVEGEFNCMTIHQLGHTVLSLGSETGARQRQSLELLASITTAYERVFVWLDNQQRSEQLLTDLTDYQPFRKKGAVLSHPKDANELLLSGELGDFLSEHGLSSTTT